MSWIDEELQRQKRAQASLDLVMGRKLPPEMIGEGYLVRGKNKTLSLARVENREIGPVGYYEPSELPPTEQPLILRTTPQALSELIKDYLWLWPFVGNIDIDTESQFKIYLAFRVWLKGDKQSDEQIVFAMALRSPETLVWINRRINPLRLYSRPNERGYYQRSIHQDCDLENDWLRPSPIESLEAALEIILPGFIKSCFPELFHALYRGGYSQFVIREEPRPLLTGKKTTRNRGPAMDELKKSVEALQKCLDEGINFGTACQTSGIGEKTVNKWILNTLDFVGQPTRARWEPKLRALGKLK
jgi:hypothetical protein